MQTATRQVTKTQSAEIHTDVKPIFNEWFRRYLMKICLRRYELSWHDAEDMISETFIRLMNSRSFNPGTPGSMKYAIVTLRRTIFRAQSRRGRVLFARLADASWLENRPENEPSESYHEYEKDVRSALNSVPLKESAAVLCKIHEWPESVVRQSTGMDMVQMEELADRAFNRIREHLQRRIA